MSSDQRLRMLRVVAYVLGKGVQTDEPLMAICSSSADQLSAGGDHPLQQAWVALRVPQCGYRQSGQIMPIVVSTYAPSM
jgi:aerobic-type carbon monoxide dehydrogenase small subunit (CoxS/CutS family)